METKAWGSELCPQCFNKLDTKSVTTENPPKFRDIYICGHCAGLSFFDRQLVLVPVTEQEFEDRYKDDKLMPVIKRALEIIKQKIRNN